MHIRVQNISQKCFGKIAITGSKSETNRLLILQSLFKNITLENISDSDDSRLLKKSLQSNSKIIDISHAGTAMRFLTAYFSIQNGREVILTGSTRMQERPIKILVNALNNLGANINYEKKEGFPPLRIKGTALKKNEIRLSASTSSQYISALLLIASRLENGIKIALKGKIASLPYIKMTLSLLKKVGIKTTFDKNTIIVFPQKNILKQKQIIESDWSSASYFFSCCALAKECKISLKKFQKDSLQGDSELINIYKKIGVNAYFESTILVIEKIKGFVLPKKLNFNLINTPDIAQTLAVTCFGLGIDCKIEGLHTLKFKETDRLEALKTEFLKLGGIIKITDSRIFVKKARNFKNNVKINTYNDHRMAMAFAPLGLKVPITILDAQVVSKSYPDFWKDMQKIGFDINMLTE